MEKEFEKMYKDYFDNFSLTKEEKIKMKENIMKTKKSKFIFKLAYIPTVLICLLLIGGIMAVTANQATRQFRVENGSRVIMENDRLDIDINADILKNKTFYTREELENLFGIKILKNRKIDNNFYKLDIEHEYARTNEEGKLTWVYFENVNNDFKKIFEVLQMQVGFSIKTKYYNKIDESWISGGKTKVEYYYIKALDTEAVIQYSAGYSSPILVKFVYNNIVYSIETSMIENTIEDIHNFLDGYIKPE